MTNAQPEHKLQVEIVKALRQRGFWPVHVPNGGKLPGSHDQRIRTGARLKAAGTVAGFPDLIVLHTDGRTGYIEVKAPKGTIQDTQKECARRLTEWGHPYALCRSLDDLEDALVAWGWVTPLNAPDGAKLRPVPPFISDDAEVDAA